MVKRKRSRAIRDSFQQSDPSWTGGSRSTAWHRSSGSADVVVVPPDPSRSYVSLTDLLEGRMPSFGPLIRRACCQRGAEDHDRQTVGDLLATLIKAVNPTAPPSYDLTRASWHSWWSAPITNSAG